MLESFWTLKNALVPFAKVHRFEVEELAFLNRCCEGNPHGWIQPSPCWIAAHGIPLRHPRPCSAYSINNIQQQTIKKKHEKNNNSYNDDDESTNCCCSSSCVSSAFLSSWRWSDNFLFLLVPSCSCISSFWWLIIVPLSVVLGVHVVASWEFGSHKTNPTTIKQAT